MTASRPHSCTMPKKVRFVEQDEIIVFDGSMSMIEKKSIYYKFDEYLEMRLSARRVANSFKEYEMPDMHESARGLGKFISVDRTRQIRRKQRVIQSVLELHRMEKSTSELSERSQEIRRELHLYVCKYLVQAKATAEKTAKMDALEAAKIYNEDSRSHHCIGVLERPMYKHVSLAALSA